jgi:murein L,D-transpeptidase YafK
VRDGSVGVSGLFRHVAFSPTPSSCCFGEDKKIIRTTNPLKKKITGTFLLTMKARQENERRAMTSFHSGRTAAGKSLAAFKERKEKKFKAKAKLIREYRKAIISMRHEDPSFSVEEKTNETSTTPLEQQITDQRRRKQRRDDPFLKARQLAEENKRMKIASKAEATERKRLAEARELDRKRRAKIMSKKTRKGQPIMNNIVKGLLEKLQKDQENSNEVKIRG